MYHLIKNNIRNCLWYNMCVIVSAKAYIVNIKKNNAESPPSASWVVNVQLYLLYTHLVSELPTLLVSQQMMS